MHTEAGNHEEGRSESSLKSLKEQVKDILENGEEREALLDDVDNNFGAFIARLKLLLSDASTGDDGENKYKAVLGQFEFCNKVFNAVGLELKFKK